MISQHFFCILQCWIFYVFTLVASTGNEQLNADIQRLNKRMKPIIDKYINQDTDWYKAMLKFRNDAFKTAMKYRNYTINDDVQKRIIDRYLDMEWKYIDETALIEIKGKGKKTLNEFRGNFQQNASKFCIDSAERDVQMQQDWKLSCEKVSPQAIKLFDELIQKMKDIAIDGHRIGLFDTVSFWKYIMGYNDNFSEQHLIKIWETELEKPYLEFMLFMRRDLEDIFNIYCGIQYRDEPMPAYIYDLIFNSYTHLGNAEEIGLSTAPTKHRMSRISKTIFPTNQFENLTIRMLTIEIQQYFESLGFDELNDYFWKKSVTETMINDNRIPIVKCHHDGYDKYWIEINAPVNMQVYTDIFQALFNIHKYRLIEMNNHPPIFWLPDYKPFHYSIIDAVTMTFMSESHWKGQRVTSNIDIENIKIKTLGVLTKLASVMAVNTWEMDILANKISPENRYCELWNRRFKYENVVPLTLSNEDYDAHNNIDFFIKHSMLFEKTNLNYNDFVSEILKYQILAHLCQQAGQYNFDNPLQYPLFQCDLKGNRRVGNILKDVLRHGSSKSWKELLDIIAGTRNTPLNGKGLIGYIAPLYEVMRKTKKYQHLLSRKKSLKRWGDFCTKQ